MSRLALIGRPFTVFDPENKQHRRWYFDFVQSSTWGQCPVRFVVPDDQGDLVTMIQRSLVKFYVEREFSKVPVPAPLVRQKRQKAVDNLP
jgi:hypothetical protein